MAELSKPAVRMFLALSDGTPSKGPKAAKRKRVTQAVLAEAAGYEPEVSYNCANILLDKDTAGETIEVSPTLDERVQIREEIKALLDAGQSGILARHLDELHEAIGE